MERRPMPSSAQGCHLVNLTQESQRSKCGCPNCAELVRPHRSVTAFFSAPLALQTTLPNTILCTLQSLQGYISHHRAMEDNKELLTWSMLWWCLVLPSPASVSSFLPLVKAASLASQSQHHTHVRHRVILKVFCHGHHLSHHATWRPCGHQQVLGAGFLCTAWLSHSCRE